MKVVALKLFCDYASRVRFAVTFFLSLFLLWLGNERRGYESDEAEHAIEKAVNERVGFILRLWFVFCGVLGERKSKAFLLVLERGNLI